MISRAEANIIRKEWPDIEPMIIGLESRMKEMGISPDHREELGEMVGNLTLQYFRMGLKHGPII